MIWVVLDANCRLGHHVFADSENNGPVGTALVKELIPHIEKQYRGSGTRFITGHSSGGWSSLWLQVAYPDIFAGCWSTAPDPVDFRDFQMINVYKKDENMFTDAKGKRRPIARSGQKPTLFYKPFSDMEEYMGRGGQLASFEAVFSPKGSDGKPRQLWDRKTGEIDSEIANAWEKYDIRLVLERNWKTLGPKLAGKIHVYMGDEDTFYLDGATRLLEEVAGGAQERRGRGDVPEEEPRHARRCRAAKANQRGDGRRGAEGGEGEGGEVSRLLDASMKRDRNCDLCFRRRSRRHSPPPLRGRSARLCEPGGGGQAQAPVTPHPPPGGEAPPISPARGEVRQSPRFPRLIARRSPPELYTEAAMHRFFPLPLIALLFAFPARRNRRGPTRRPNPTFSPSTNRLAAG